MSTLLLFYHTTNYHKKGSQTDQLVNNSYDVPIILHISILKTI
ncbi:hypothetical protein CLOSTHATH_06947 [Hungatella hathewayi DSM 13479]|uniref:Uncharacterized protein n=1 Tax=Hungatella hathewayi DSM 13479 TaxID=566550 RepID=D3ATI7_9FIRM|nr:hypothetical protein CLOSTHATH_06947 [Hungatella hathewayi DSM 13479]